LEGSDGRDRSGTWVERDGVSIPDAVGEGTRLKYPVGEGESDRIEIPEPLDEFRSMSGACRLPAAAADVGDRRELAEKGVVGDAPVGISPLEMYASRSSSGDGIVRVRRVLDFRGVGCRIDRSEPLLLSLAADCRRSSSISTSMAGVLGRRSSSGTVRVRIVLGLLRKPDKTDPLLLPLAEERAGEDGTEDPRRLAGSSIAMDTLRFAGDMDDDGVLPDDGSRRILPLPKGGGSEVIWSSRDEKLGGSSYDTTSVFGALGDPSSSSSFNAPIDGAVDGRFLTLPRPPNSAGIDEWSSLYPSVQVKFGGTSLSRAFRSASNFFASAEGRSFFAGVSFAASPGRT